MTTITQFVPTTRAPFQFQATLDGQIYSVAVPWSLFGKRFYIDVRALDGTPVIYTALIGSTNGFLLQSLTWQRGIATAIAVAPHGYRVGKTIDLTISGCAPDAYNGQVQGFITGPNSFSYPVATPLGPATAVGAATFNINLVGGLFASLLVFRESTQQFEVSP